jgi:hypothetical protein
LVAKNWENAVLKLTAQITTSEKEVSRKLNIMTRGVSRIGFEKEPCPVSGPFHKSQKKAAAF